MHVDVLLRYCYSVSDKYFGKNKLFRLSYRQWCSLSSFPLPPAGEARRGLASNIVFQINILVKINYFNCLTGNGAHFQASLSRLRERLGEGWLLMARSFSPKYLSEKL